MNSLEVIVCVLVSINLITDVRADEGTDPTVGLVVAAVIAFLVFIAAIGICILGIVWNDWFQKRQWKLGREKLPRIDEMKHERFDDERSVVSRTSRATSSIHNHVPKMSDIKDVRFQFVPEVYQSEPVMNGQLQSLDSPRYEEKGQMLKFHDEDGGNYQVTSPSEINYNENQIVPIRPQRQEVVKREFIPIVKEITHDEPIITHIEKQPVIVKVVHKYPTATQIVEEPVIAEVTHDEKVVTKRVDVPVVKEIEHDQPIVTRLEERPVITKELHKYPTSTKIVEKPVVKSIEHDEPMITGFQEREVVAREVHRYPTATKVVERPVIRTVDHDEAVITGTTERPVITKELHKYPTSMRVVETPITKTIEHGQSVVTNMQERPVVVKELHKYPTSTKVVDRPVVRNIEHGQPIVTRVVEQPKVVKERHAYPIVRGSVRDGGIVERVIQMPDPPPYEVSKKVSSKKGSKKPDKSKKNENKTGEYETVTGVMNFAAENPNESSTSYDSDSDSYTSTSGSSASGYIQPIVDNRSSSKSQSDKQWAMY